MKTLQQLPRCPRGDGDPVSGVSGSHRTNSWSSVLTVSGHSIITMWLPSSITFRKAISRIWRETVAATERLIRGALPALGTAAPGVELEGLKMQQSPSWVLLLLAAGWGAARGLPPTWGMQIRTKARGNEYQPNNRKRKRTHGWIKRISTPAGIEVILRRMLKGRKSLSH
uniref:Large ribosomal subunit protein bL34m n=1 Tax=Strix occidentalis caurina TaxID=311401 RepID=A0A8D0FNA4_STROC